MFSLNLFKAYDIRGIYGTELTEDFAYEFGRVFVHVLGVKEVAIGFDARNSSPTLANALAQGIMDMGANVIDLGMVSSDMVYFATGQYQYEAGIMVTASHNPGEYNGFKACFRDAVPIVFDSIQDFMMSGNKFNKAEFMGTNSQVDIYEDWVNFVLTFVDIEYFPKMKVVIDAGNGVAGKFCSKLFEKLPMIELVPLYFEPDGNFPNHPAYPIQPENLVDLKGRMEQENADLGIAFDGDADRVVLVDNNYEEISGTVMTAMIVEMMLKKDRNQTFVYNALVGSIMPELLSKYDATGHRVRVGHTFMKQAMKEFGASFGGEHSAHYYFAKNWNADSGIIAAMIVMELLGREGKLLSVKRNAYEKYVESGEINFKVLDISLSIEKVKVNFKDLEQDTLDGVTFYGEGFWFNVRPSNTEPLLRLNVEGDTREIVERVVGEVRGVLA